MKKFLLGLIVGIFLASYIYLFLNIGPQFHVTLGHLLDKDTLYLKDGSVLQGWIIKKDSRNIWFAQEKGYFTLPLSQCEIIQENALLQYIWELI
ncbi:MAG: hypothetical protein JW869_00840 [Candidatus Omnitrophica bacterium]|nr:hypothetical protein [Candidatus Omnitrophota bacterium]